MTERIKILVSACLLGEQVRYDGGHKNETLDPFAGGCCFSPTTGGITRRWVCRSRVRNPVDHAN